MRGRQGEIRLVREKKEDWLGKRGRSDEGDKIMEYREPQRWGKKRKDRERRGRADDGGEWNGGRK